MKYIILTSILLFVSPSYADLTTILIKVYDGDTIKVQLKNGSYERVRFLGIDTPESCKRRYGYIEYYGKEAKLYLRRTLGKKIILKGKLKRDRYKRLLAYVYSGEKDICKDLLIKGYAKVYKRIKCSRYKEFIKYETIAKKKRLGVWK